MADPASPPRVIVAFSGGLDSTVLLHAVCGLADRVRVHAVHVHHGLQAGADDWLAHCRAMAQAWGATFSGVRLPPRVAVGEGIETWARRRRYEALDGEAARLSVDWVLTAHHADDQAETVLLRLARGTGLLGLQAMAAQRPWAGRQLLRPLLALPRQQLLDYAKANQLVWLDDPSNAQPMSARNALRLQVLPALSAAVPGARTNLLRAAALAEEAQSVLEEVAAADLSSAQALARLRLRDEPAALSALVQPSHGQLPLCREAILSLSTARQHLLLRRWLTEAGLATPSQAVLAEVRKQLLASRGAYGEVIRPSAVLRRFRDYLFIDPLRAVPQLPQPPLSLNWQGQTPLCLPDAFIDVRPAAGGVPSALLLHQPIQVRALPASTRVRLRPDGSSRSLKHWHQALGIPARLRASLPGVFVGEHLVHVAGLGTHYPSRTAPSDAEGWALVWRPSTRDDPRWAICQIDATVLANASLPDNEGRAIND